MTKQHLRLIFLAILYIVPIAGLLGLGVYYLWLIGWWFWASLALLGCWGLALFLAHRWQAKRQLFGVDFTPPLHSTDRDKQALKLVEEHANQIKEMDPEQTTNWRFYANSAEELAKKLVHLYYPKAKDPFGPLTIPEILAVVELASHDVSNEIRQKVPGSHLLTVQHMRHAPGVINMYRIGSNVIWGISAILAPQATIAKYLLSRATIGAGTEALQKQMWVWLYREYVNRVGRYLIEVYSGRLRVGADRLRQLRQELESKDCTVSKTEDADPAVTTTDELPNHVTITIVGQVKAGKSSLINALLGDQQATTSVLPETDKVTAYEVQPDGITSNLRILDTVGYGHEGPKADQLRETQTAAQKTDVMLLVLHAKNPARQADLTMLQKLRQWFDVHPDLKMPSILAVVTHIDLLSPQMEWDPPYNWQKPVRPKEQNIEQAVAAVREQLGEHLTGAVPVCVAEGKVYGVSEELIPAMTQLMEESRAVALLRCLHDEANEGKFRKIFEQTLSGGKALAKVLWKEMTS